MGDLEHDTAVTPAGSTDERGGSYRATLHDAWEIWGPCGGYVASIALRAAGAHATFDRPVSFSCHYLGVASFDDVELHVVTLRTGRSVESLRVSMSQGGRPVLEALVLAGNATDALEHDVTTPPEVPDPRRLPSVAERLAGLDAPPPYPFWRGIDSRPIEWADGWPPPGPLAPSFREWQRFVPRSTFDDPWVDACRSLMWIDVGGWPAANRHHAWRSAPWVAVNVDLYAAFHRPSPSSEFLLLDAHAPVGSDGLIGYRCDVWSEERALVASGGGQLLCRPVPAVPGAMTP